MLAAQDVQVVGRDAQLSGIFCHLMLLAEMTLNQLSELRQHLGQRLLIVPCTSTSAQFCHKQEDLTLQHIHLTGAFIAVLFDNLLQQMEGWLAEHRLDYRMAG